MSSEEGQESKVLNDAAVHFAGGICDSDNLEYSKPHIMSPLPASERIDDQHDECRRYDKEDSPLTRNIINNEVNHWRPSI